MHRVIIACSLLFLLIGQTHGSCSRESCKGPVRQLFDDLDCTGYSEFEELSLPKTCTLKSKLRYEEVKCSSENSTEVEHSIYFSEEGCNVDTWISSEGWVTGICMNVWDDELSYRSIVYWCDVRQSERQNVRIVGGHHHPALPLSESIRCPNRGCVTDFMSFYYADSQCLGGLADLQPAWERQIRAGFCFATTTRRILVRLIIDDNNVATVLYYYKRCEEASIFEFKRVKLDKCVELPFGSFAYRLVNESLMNEDRSGLIDQTVSTPEIWKDDGGFTAGLAILLVFAFLFFGGSAIALISYILKLIDSEDSHASTSTRARPSRIRRKNL